MPLQFELVEHDCMDGHGALGGSLGPEPRRNMISVRT